MQGGTSAGLEPKNDDTIASLDGTRSVGDNNDAETDGATCHGAEHLLDLLCDVTSDNAPFGKNNSDVVATMAAQRSGKAAATHATFDDALSTSYDITPYSEIYGFLPSTMVAAHNGCKPVSARACHSSGKSSDVRKARLAAISGKRNHDSIDMFHRTVIRTEA